MSVICDVTAALVNASAAVRARKGQPLMLTFIQHRDGIWYFDAPLPWRWHKCRAWTIAIIGSTMVQRCACGAISMDGGMWIEKNSERRNGGKAERIRRTKGNDSLGGISQTIPKHSRGNSNVDFEQSGGITIEGSNVQHSSGDKSE